jgi:hypothetical protein
MIEYYKPKVDNDNIHRKYNKLKKQEISRWKMIHFPYNRLNVLDISHISPIIFKLWMFDRNLCHFNLYLFYLRSQIALTA